MPLLLLLFACLQPKPGQLEVPCTANSNPELFNGVDDNCNGEVDEGVEIQIYSDSDGDGFGAGSSFQGCVIGSGQSATGDDCDDADPTIYPNAEDACEDGIDQDCDPRELQCVFQAEYTTADADAKIYSSKANYTAGEYMAVGDISGDGVPDLAVTTMYADGYNGGGYVLYGPLSGTMTLDDAGDKLVGSRNTSSVGRSIAVGDLTGDGIEDVAIGAPDDTCREWVLAGPLIGDIDLESAGIIRIGQFDTEVGHGSAIGDVNGDGTADLLIGAYEDNQGGFDAGAVFVELGPVQEGTATVNETADLMLIGESRSAYAGRYVASGKDVNGDGLDDILVAAPYATGGAPASGAAYLVYGGAMGEVSLRDADAKYLGESSNDYAGEGLTMGMWMEMV
jgi:hypothetical protein